MLHWNVIYIIVIILRNGNIIGLKMALEVLAQHKVIILHECKGIVA